MLARPIRESGLLSRESAALHRRAKLTIFPHGALDVAYSYVRIQRPRENLIVALLPRRALVVGGFGAETSGIRGGGGGGGACEGVSARRSIAGRDTIWPGIPGD